MMTYNISPIVMRHLHGCTGFRRCAEKTVNETIGWMHDPAAHKHECQNEYYLSNHNYTNMWYALDCEYIESIDRTPYSEEILRLY